MDVLGKAVVAGLVTAIIVIASPIFTIIALLAVGSKGSIEAFRAACLAGVKTVPAYLCFIGVCYLLVRRVDYRVTIVAG